jgi:integrase
MLFLPSEPGVSLVVVESRNPTLALVVEAAKSKDALPYWAARWREGDQQPKVRLGAAWLAPTGSADAKAGGKTYGQSNQWTQRRGRAPEGVLDEAAALVLASNARKKRSERMAAEAEERRRQEMSFRALAREWQANCIKIGRHKPATARDVATTLAEPGELHKRGGGETRGIVMRLLGDLPAHKITAEDIEMVFEEYDELGRSGRTINKARENLRAIFNHGRAPKNGWGLTSNPAAETDRRHVDEPDNPPFFELEEVEAIAQAAAEGKWRGAALATYNRNPLAAQQEQEENEQLADLIRFAAYTGLRRGEIAALRWADIKWDVPMVEVSRALSADVIKRPKSGKTREVALSDRAVDALKHIKSRPNFTGADDFVFATLAGDRPDPSAIRRRYVAARNAAGAPELTFHGLRHTAATWFVRQMDPRDVQKIMGHASLKTTERYLGARRAQQMLPDVNRAHRTDSGRNAERLLSELQELDQEARALLMQKLAAVA